MSRSSAGRHKSPGMSLPQRSFGLAVCRYCQLMAHAPINLTCIDPDLRALLRALGRVHNGATRREC